MPGWDANWATSQGRGKIALNAFNQLRAALAERHAETASPPTLPPVFATGEILPPSWFAAFQAAITNIIPKWIDHTQYSGDYSGLAYNGAKTIPLWSESSILAAIGAASRLPAPGAAQIPLAAWAYQQYLITNKLLWGRGRYYGYTQGASWQNRDGRGANFAAAVAAMNAAAWANGDLSLAGSAVSLNFGHVCEYYSAGTMVQVGRARVNHSTATWGGTPCNVDGYILGNYGSGTPGQPNFYNADNGLLYNKLFKFVSDGAAESLVSIGNYGNATVTDPGPDRQGWGSLSTMEWFPVCKFDITGGFNYK